MSGYAMGRALAWALVWAAVGLVLTQALRFDYCGLIEHKGGFGRRVKVLSLNRLLPLIVVLLDVIGSGRLGLDWLSLGRLPECFSV